MEKDFLSLNWKDSSSIRMNKTRSNNLCKDSVLGEQLSFPFKNIPSPQQLMMPKASQEDERRKFATNSLASATVIFPFFSSSFAFDSNRKAPLFQKENALTLPVLDDMVQSGRHSSFNNIDLYNQKSAVVAPTKTLPFDGLLPAKPHLVPLNQDSVNGFNNNKTYLRVNAKTTLSLSSSLTIFYGDEVHVYNDVSPEKAQTVNQMAENGSFEGVKEVNDVQRHQFPGVVYSVENAVPMAQARRATLARFLERRKHRLTNARPYAIGKLLAATDLNLEMTPSLLQDGTASSSEY